MVMVIFMKKISLISMLVAISMCVFIIEAQIPLPVPFPGVKCGLSNVLVLVTMILLDKKSGAGVLLLRIILTAAVLGQGASFFYSLFGGLSAFLVMALLLKPLKSYTWVISTFGATAHNTGQIICAVIFMGTAVVSYYPILIISGIITGAFTGILAQLIVNNTLIKKLFSGVLK